MKLKRSCEFFLYLKPFYKKKKTIKFSLWTCQLNKVTQDFICIRIFIGSSINSNRQRFLLGFQTEFCQLLRVFREKRVWLFAKFLCLLLLQTRKPFCSRRFASPARRHWRVNEWIALDIRRSGALRRLSSQSEHAKNTIHCFSIC